VDGEGEVLQDDGTFGGVSVVDLFEGNEGAGEAEVGGQGESYRYAVLVLWDLDRLKFGIKTSFQSVSIP